MDAGLSGSKPRLFDVAQVRFHEQIGRNTEYIIHREEVLADNFVLLVNGGNDVPSPRIIREMRQIFQEPRATALGHKLGKDG